MITRPKKMYWNKNINVSTTHFILRFGFIKMYYQITHSKLDNWANIKIHDKYEVRNHIWKNWNIKYTMIKGPNLF